MSSEDQKTPARVLEELFSQRLVPVEQASPDLLEDAKKWSREVIEFCQEEISAEEEYYSELAQPWDDIDRLMYEEFTEEKVPDLMLRIDHLEHLLKKADEGDNEAQQKTFESGGEYIQRRLLEVSFARKVIPPRRVSEDGPRKINHDTLVKIIDVEPKSKAMAITFRGQPSKGFTRAERAEIPFFKGEEDAPEDE